jgi:putative heme iron utilization protein
MSSQEAGARVFLRRHHAGSLATLSQRLSGYPFGSVVPFMLDHAARPVILVSRLAEHTRNIAADSRVSLLVSDAADDVQAGARLTLIGDAARAEGDLAALRARYLRYFPEAERLLALGDFDFHRIEPVQVRFISGFADIHWISAAAYAPPANELAGDEDAVIAYMNTEHAGALRDCCRFFHDRETARAIMVGIDCDGFDLRAEDASPRAALRVEFDHPVITAAEARAQLLALAKKARPA